MGNMGEWDSETIKELEAENAALKRTIENVQICYDSLKRENEGLTEGLMQIRTMRLQMPLVNCVPIIDALLTGGNDETE